MFVPMHEMLPMVHPNDLVIDGKFHSVSTSVCVFVCVHAHVYVCE